MNNFFGTIFELIYSSNLSPDLYDANLYGLVGIIMLISSILFCVIFYFGMNKTKFASPLYWFLIMLVMMITVFLVAWLVPSRRLSGNGIEHPTSSYIYFGFVVVLYAAVIYFVLSLILKRFSTNLARTPF